MSGFGDFFRHCLIVIWQRVNLELISRSSIPNFVFESCKFQLFRHIIIIIIIIIIIMIIIMIIIIMIIIIMIIIIIIIKISKRKWQI